MTTVSPHYRRDSRATDGGTWRGTAGFVARLPPLLGDLLLVALALVVSLGLRGALSPVIEFRQPFITAYPVLLLLVLFRSSRAATIYLIAAAIAHWYIFIPEYYGLRFIAVSDFIVLLAFIMVAAIIVTVAHAHRRSRTQLLHETEERRAAEDHVRALNAELEQRVNERTRQLQESNRELESFSYSVSHDLRAPLRHIAGFTEMLQKRISPRLDETDTRYMKIIQDAVARAGALVDELLAFSRMARAELMETQVATRALIEEVVAEYENETQERSIQWTIHDDIPQVHADPSMLRQVWRNLINNAVKYTRHTPRPVIEIGSTTEDAAENEVVFYVRDNGVGFDMKYVDKLFGVFQRLHRPDEFEGTGIGLANVRRIIHRHGGRTWAKAAPGKGATFYFSLPAHRERTEE